MSSFDSEATIAGFRSSGHWRDEVLVDYVDRWAEEEPDRVVLTDGYSSLTTAQLRRSAYRFAAALRGLGVDPGDRVLVQLPSWNEFVVVYVALARIGAVLVPQMPIYRDDEVGYAVQHSGAKVLVVPGEFRRFDHAAMAVDIRATAPELEQVVTVRCGPRPDSTAPGTSSPASSSRPIAR